MQITGGAVTLQFLPGREDVCNGAEQEDAERETALRKVLEPIRHGDVLVVSAQAATAPATTVGNQTALDKAAPADRIGTASGLFRTFGYLGTITSSVIGGIAFRDGVNDHGLHVLGVVLVVAGLAALLLTVLDRSLMRPRGAVV